MLETRLMDAKCYSQQESNEIKPNFNLTFNLLSWHRRPARDFDFQRSEVIELVNRLLLRLCLDFETLDEHEVRPFLGLDQSSVDVP